VDVSQGAAGDEEKYQGALDWTAESPFSHDNLAE